MSSVIICTDGSPLAEEAAARGFSLLRPVDQVVLVTVVEPEPTGLAATMPSFGVQPGMPPPVPADHEEVMEQVVVSSGEATLQRLAGQLGLDDAELRVLTGSKPGEAICAFAEELNAEVIVMSSRGLGGIKRAVLGSVSGYVSRTATCPVLIVPAHAVRT